MSMELAPQRTEAERPSGPAAAVVLAAGIGVLVLGLFTSLNEASTGVHDWLAFDAGVGPLSGKTSLAMAAFFGSWAALTALWRRANPPLRRIAAVTAVLVLLGFLGTFPEFFELLAE